VDGTKMHLICVAYIIVVDEEHY